jgi:hypothetical protein
MNDFFFRIGRTRDATQALVGVVAFLLALEVQWCSSFSAVTCNTTKMAPHELLKHQKEKKYNLCIKKHTMTVGAPCISTLT